MIAMRLVVALLVLSALAAHARDANVVGIVQRNGYEIELYQARGLCEAGEGRGASVYPIGRRHEFTEGCWKALDDTFIVRFKDGTVLQFLRQEIIPGKKIGNML
jgi:hypothetical protein